MRKKIFVVPDAAITASGRMVQCGSCGNKWKQYPINEDKNNKPALKSSKIVSNTKPTPQKTQKIRKVKKSVVKKLER